MKYGRPFVVVGPDGRPLHTRPHQNKARIGDEVLTYFTSRGFGRRPIDNEEAEEIIFQHELMIHALVREVVSLRQRLHIGEDAPILWTPRAL